MISRSFSQSEPNFDGINGIGEIPLIPSKIYGGIEGLRQRPVGGGAFEFADFFFEGFEALEEFGEAAGEGLDLEALFDRGGMAAT